MQQTPDMQQLLRLAQSPAGQQLMEALRNSGSETKAAADLAAAGDMDRAKQALSGLLRSPDLQKLLRQLEDQL